MSAISGTRRALKELVDGTIRVQIDIDPRFKAEFHQLFPHIDMPVALAPLASDFEQKEEKPKIGPLCLLTVRWCKEKEFWKFLEEFYSVECANEDAAKAHVIDFLEITSRKEIDNYPESFNTLIRGPYMDWLKRNID